MRSGIFAEAAAGRGVPPVSVTSTHAHATTRSVGASVFIRLQQARDKPQRAVLSLAPLYRSRTVFKQLLQLIHLALMQRGHPGRMAFLAAIVAALVLASPAYGAQSCPDRVLADWSADQVLDGTYAPSCLERTLRLTGRDAASGLVEAIDAQLADSVRAAPATKRETDSLPRWLLPAIALAAIMAAALALRRP